ncbi:hypothetical protein [Streptomyces niveus]|uniref:DUF2171 domain-containing protein n=1 Tax=Streptomyces niveus TaxID=193462 RepID=A0ABZ2A7B2_STRNV|nr:hypothetical protein [Streptomyces niveus]
MSGCAGEGGAFVPDVGTYAVDSRDGRVGQVMALDDDCVQLRPPGGGVEWDVPPGWIHPAPPNETLRAKVTELNRARRLP